ncbi:MAG TPA: PEGA domain-containing protein [Terriglobales bacterium]|nr:PEGA domain-containing protein [Terriglobales bacterium]
MRHVFTKSLAMFLSFSLLAYGQGNTFTRVRYNGGSVASKVDPKDWNNKMIVTSDAITLEFKDGQKLVIAPKSVMSLSYGQEAHRRVGTMVALAILVAPVALFGLFHKTRLHYIGIQYATPDTKNAGILLQGDKDNYRAMLVALQGVTGVPVSVGEKERGFIPVGVTTSVTKESEGTKPAEKTAAASPAEKPATKETAPAAETAAATATSAAPAVAAPTDATGTVSVTSTPDAAEVYVDGSFYGNSPVTLKMKPGKHTISVKMSGYKEWSREITTDAGSEAHLAATLEKAE